MLVGASLLSLLLVGAVGNEALLGGVGVVVVATEDPDAAHQDLAVVSQPDRGPGKRQADAADPGRAGQVDRAGGCGLGQAVALQNGHAGATVEVAEPLAQRPAAGDDVGDPAAQERAQRGEDQLVKGRALSPQCPGGPGWRVQGTGVGDGGLGRQTEDLLLGPCGPGVRGVVDLLEDAGHCQHKGGPEQPQVGDEVLHVRGVPHHAVLRAHDRDLDEAREHVGQGQEEQRAYLSAAQDLGHVVAGVQCEVDQVAVGELSALGPSGGARGVDDGGQALAGQHGGAIVQDRLVSVLAGANELGDGLLGQAEDLEVGQRRVLRLEGGDYGLHSLVLDDDETH